MERFVERVAFDAVPKLPQMQRVAAYARVSTGKDAMQHSLSAQISYYSAYIQRHPGWVYVGVYADAALTGTKDNRDGFQRLMADCRAGKIDVVLTKSIARLARNTVTLLETVRELKALGIDVFFEEENIHSLSTEGELMLTILASYAQEESLSVSENMKWKVRKNFQEGSPWNGTVLGYRIENRQYVVVENEAAIVREIYRLYLDGNGYEAIAAELNCRNLKTRNGNAWSHASVLWILHNYSYTGNLLLQTTYTENHITKKYRMNSGELPMYHAEHSHEPIISLETYEAVQEESKRRAEKYGKKENGNQSPLAGRVYCGLCGKRCRRKRRHQRFIWICNMSSMKGQEACRAKAVPEEVLMEIAAECEAEKLIVCDNNTVRAVSQTGDEQIRQWAYVSRSESWTKDKRKEQAERMKAVWNRTEP